MAAGPIASAYVVIHPDFEGFEDELEAGTQGALRRFIDAAGRAVDGFTAPFRGLGRKIGDLTGSIPAPEVGLPDFSNVTGAATGAATAVGSAFDAVPQNVADDFGRITPPDFTSMSLAGSTAATSIADAFSGLAPAVQGHFRPLPNIARASFGDIEGAASSFVSNMRNRLQGMADLSGAFDVFERASRFFTSPIRIGITGAAALEQTTIGFEALLGAGEKTQQFLAEMRDFAARTPFELPQLQDAAKRLTAVGFAAQDVIPELTKIGNTAAVLGAPAESINSVVVALGRIKGSGRATIGDLELITDALPGFNAVEAIAKQMGVTVPEAFEAMGNGGVEASIVIDGLLAGMERFPGAAGAMEKQALTLNGMLSTFKDTVNQALVEGLGPVVPAIKNALGPLTTILGDLIGTVAPVIGEFASAILPDLVDVFAELKGELGGGLVALIKGLAPIFTTIVSAAAPLLSVLGRIATALGEALQRAFVRLEPYLPQLLDAFGKLAQVVGGALIDVIVELVNTVTDLAIIAMPPLVQLFHDLEPLMPPLIQALANIVSPMLQLMPAIMPLVEVALPPFVEALGTLARLLAEHPALVQGLVLAYAGVQVVGSVTGVLTSVSGSLLAMGNNADDAAKKLPGVLGQLQDLRSNLQQLPESKPFTVASDGVDSAKQQVQGLVDKLGEVKDKTFKVSGTADMPDLDLDRKGEAAGKSAGGGLTKGITSAISGAAGAIGGAIVSALIGAAGGITAGAVATAAAIVAAVVAAIVAIFLVVKYHEQIGNALGTAFEAAATFVTETIPRIFGVVVEAIGNFFTQTLPGFLAELPTIIGRGLGVAVAGLILIVAGIPALIIKALIAFVPKLLGLGGDLLGAIIDGLVTGIPALAGLGLRIGTAILGFLINLPIQALQLIGQLVGAILNGLFGLLAQAPGVMARVVGGIIGFLAELPGKALNIAAALPGQIIGAISSLVTEGPALFANFSVASIGFIAELPAKLPGLIMQAIEGLLNILASLPGRALGFFRGVLTGAFDIFGQLISFLFNLPVLSTVADIFKKFLEGFKEGFRQVDELVGGALTDIVDFFKNLPGRIGEFLGKIGDKAAEVGKSIVNGISNAVTGAGGAALDFAKAFANTLIGFLNDKVLGPIRTGINTLADVIGGVDIPFAGRAFDAASRVIRGVADVFKIPKLETGAIISRSAGGSLVNVGEGRYDEAVLPLPPGLLDGLMRLANRPLGGGGGTTVITVPVTVEANFGPGTNADDVLRAMREIAQSELSRGLSAVIERTAAGAGRLG